MIIVDAALENREKAGNPIRVGIIGAGYMGRGVVLQILSAIKGMDVAVVYNRTISQAELAFKQAGVDSIVKVDTAAELEDAIKNRQYAITDDPMLLCEAEGIDAVMG